MLYGLILERMGMYKKNNWQDEAGRVYVVYPEKEIMDDMDRCWFSDDGYQVTSRILITDWGKVEHAAITYNGDEENLFSFDGSRDIPWSVKQEIKNEVFGIHPTKDKQCRVVNRGCPKDPTQLALNSQGMLSNTKDRNKSKTFLSHRRRLPPLQVASKK